MKSLLFFRRYKGTLACDDIWHEKKTTSKLGIAIVLSPVELVAVIAQQNIKHTLS